MNFHYVRLTVWRDRLIGTMVRYEAEKKAGAETWSEPDWFEIRARN